MCILSYISSSHLGNKSSGDENCCTEHHYIVLETENDSLGWKKEKTHNFEELNANKVVKINKSINQVPTHPPINKIKQRGIK